MEVTRVGTHLVLAHMRGLLVEAQVATMATADQGVLVAVLVGMKSQVEAQEEPSNMHH